jgi:hypothetical protein
MNGNIYVQKKKNQKNTGTFSIIFNVSRPASTATEGLSSEIRRLELKEKRLLKKYRDLEILNIRNIDTDNDNININNDKRISMPSVIENIKILPKIEIKSPISIISLLVSSITIDGLPPYGSLHIPSNKSLSTTLKHYNSPISVISPALQSSLYLEFNLISCQDNSSNHGNPSITVISPSNSIIHGNSSITVKSPSDLVPAEYVYKAIASFHLDSKASWDAPFKEAFILYENHIKLNKNNDTNNCDDNNDSINDWYNRDRYYDDNTISKFSSEFNIGVEKSFLGVQIFCAGEKYGFLSVSVKSLKALMMNSDDGQITVILIYIYMHAYVHIIYAYMYISTYILIYMHLIQFPYFF